jgi:hypothetical protein
MHSIKWRICRTILSVPIAPSVEQKLNIRDWNIIEPHEESAASYWSSSAQECLHFNVVRISISVFSRPRYWNKPGANEIEPTLTSSNTSVIFCSQILLIILLEEGETWAEQEKTVFSVVLRWNRPVVYPIRMMMMFLIPCPTSKLEDSAVRNRFLCSLYAQLTSTSAGLLCPQPKDMLCGGDKKDQLRPDKEQRAVHGRR